MAQQNGGQPGGRVGEEGEREDATTFDILARLSGALSALKAHPECRLAAYLPKLETVVNSMWQEEAAPKPRSGPTLLSPEQMSPAVEAIAAALRLNDVSPEDGFDMFDINKDNGIGFADLVQSLEVMQLDVTKKDWQKLFKALGLGKNDVINRTLWSRLIGEAHAMEEEHDKHMERAEMAMKLAQQVALQGDAEGAMRFRELAQRELEHAGNLKGDVEDVHAGIQSKVDRQDTNGNALVNADTTARALTNGVSGNLPKTRDLAVNEDTNAGALMDGGPSSKETSVCSKCRAPMNPKYTFCNKCGQAVNTAQTAASSLPSPPPPPKTRDLAIGSSSSNSNSNSNSNNKSSSKIAPTSPSLQLPEDSLYDEQESGEDKIPPNVQKTVDLISATLVYNKMTAEKGYKSFDLDKDGVVGRADLLGVAQRLDMEAEEVELLDAFNYLATVDATGRQVITIETWLREMNAANAHGVLQEVLSKQLMRMINYIAEVIAYNNLTPEKGFAAFDNDRDGKISIGDLEETFKRLQIQDVHAEDIVELAAFLDRDGDGFIDREEWAEVMRRATCIPASEQPEQDNVSRQRDGVIKGSKSNTTAKPARGQRQSKVIQARKPSKVVTFLRETLAYNNLSATEGYSAFDLDGDGLLSLSDLKNAAATLDLDLRKDELELFFRALDSQGSGYISKTAWSAAVNLCVGVGQGLGVDGGVCMRMSLAKGSSNFVIVSTCFHELETDHLVQTPSSYLLSLPHSLVSSPHHHTHVQLSE